MRKHGIIPKVLEDSFLLLCYTNTESFQYRRTFQSELYKKAITPMEENYMQIICSELNYRINAMSKENCCCINCKEELSKYVSTLEKIKSNLKEEKHSSQLI